MLNFRCPLTGLRCLWGLMTLNRSCLTFHLVLSQRWMMPSVFSCGLQVAPEQLLGSYLVTALLCACRSVCSSWIYRLGILVQVRTSKRRANSFSKQFPCCPGLNSWTQAMCQPHVLGQSQSHGALTCFYCCLVVMEIFREGLQSQQYGYLDGSPNDNLQRRHLNNLVTLSLLHHRIQK